MSTNKSSISEYGLVFFSKLSELAENNPEAFQNTRKQMIDDFLSENSCNGNLIEFQHDIEIILRSPDALQVLKDIVLLIEKQVCAFERLKDDVMRFDDSIS